MNDVRQTLDELEDAVDRNTDGLCYLYESQPRVGEEVGYIEYDSGLKITLSVRALPDAEVTADLAERPKAVPA